MSGQKDSTARGDQATGRFVMEDGLEWFRIDDFDLLDPFLINLVTPTDQWMFISSSGALTAGRRSAGRAVFPYETDDRLHRAGGRTGSLTLVRVAGEPGTWEPFAAHVPQERVRRSLSKTAAGDRLRFEEHHPGLGLTFRYTWACAGRFGFVRTCELLRHDGLPPVDVDIFDGLLDVLPAGVDLHTQQTASTLVDAYRRAEWDDASGIALFTLEALVSDQAEPAESLRANTAWSWGLGEPVVMLSDRQTRRFISGRTMVPEHLVTGRKGGFFVSASDRVEPDAPLRWGIVIEAWSDHAAVARLRAWLAATHDPEVEVAEAVDRTHDDLIRIVADADGLQETADRRATVHHFANVLFNIMRGGVFRDDHRITVADVGRFVDARNRRAGGRFPAASAGLPPVVEVGEIRDAVSADPDLSRIVDEYLPLSFSRRHGDPSRPWNSFHIAASAAAGSTRIGYEGNWRDIFQNWDALVHSFPDFIEPVVAKFLNASTVDGHNPYRITDRGIDWEMPEEGDWANFGYWGDHQITYLYRLLDAARRFHPGSLEGTLDRVRFSYADVPYRIRDYPEIVRDPKHTLVFDEARQAAVEARVESIGADGRLIPNGDGVHHASLAEKLLVPALAKLSNLVAGGGIWMNTQRPEWNDANNALVGNGVSAVTLFHLRDYLTLVDGLLEGATVERVPIGHHVLGWLEALGAAFTDHAAMLDAEEITPEDRRSLLDALGAAFSDYRAAAYERGPGAPVEVPVTALRDFIAAARPHLDRVAGDAHRPDGLVESYCVVILEPGAARLEPLYEMLEGQVAAVGALDTDAKTAIRIVDAMYDSGLYRPDQRSFLLYPNRMPPSFLDKNVVPEASAAALAALADAGSGIVYRDDSGAVRFAADFRSARDLEAALDEAMHGPLADLIQARRAELLDAYEEVFDHSSFTGRSGTMYKYEGLGSIYWHMVSKLLFALQERLLSAAADGVAGEEVTALAERYRLVRSGLGFVKSVAEQGTFPTDPHSHTPGHTGAQQPGMTGQVKEGVLLRWGELGVRVEDGCVRFQPVLLARDEFLTASHTWELPTGPVPLAPGTLGFTYCGVPVVYHLDEGEPWTVVSRTDGGEQRGGSILDRETSRELFARRGAISRIDVGVPPSRLLSSGEDPD